MTLCHMAYPPRPAPAPVVGCSEAHGMTRSGGSVCSFNNELRVESIHIDGSILLGSLSVCHTTRIHICGASARCICTHPVGSPLSSEVPRGAPRMHAAAGFLSWCGNPAALGSLSAALGHRPPPPGAVLAVAGAGFVLAGMTTGSFAIVTMACSSGLGSGLKVAP